MLKANKPLQGYYFEVEKPSTKSPLWFAYIWREEDDATTAPPVKEFHSMADNADEIVSNKAAQWIKKHGVMV